MAWDLLYVFQMSKPQTFQELATKAYDMEVTTSNHRGSSFSVAEPKNSMAKFKKNVKFSTSSTKEAMSIPKAEPIRITGRPNPQEKRSAPFKDIIKKRHL